MTDFVITICDQNNLSSDYNIYLHNEQQSQDSKMFSAHRLI